MKPLQIFGRMLTDEEPKEVKTLANSVVASLGRVVAAIGAVAQKRKGKG